jgi:hypothetical protein
LRLRGDAVPQINLLIRGGTLPKAIALTEINARCRSEAANVFSSRVTKGSTAMAKTPGMTKSTEDAAPQADLTMPDLGALLKANAETTQHWLDMWRGTAVELGNFATKRWTRDMELARRLCHCQTPADVLGLQAEFVNETLKEYMDEAAKLMVRNGEALAASDDAASRPAA